ncbi:hypothetical protein PENSPDRAFT_655027 [Peniophora sp. CONT]|nr:hypothetical protein PENSPDRAFT_655027 [Peniophora sp. CONT]
MAPVYRLPTEILLLVFTILASQDRPAQSVFEFGEGTLGWVRATHVCRTWRNILLADSDIWAGDVGLLPKATATFLERSGDRAPLELWAIKTSMRTRDHEFWREWRAMPLHRARVLHGTISHVGDITLFADLLALHRLHPLSELRELHTTFSSGDQASLVPDSMGGLEFELVQMPALRLWTSRRFYIRITAPNLVKLHLSDFFLKAGALLELLDSARHLEHFSCEGFMLNVANLQIHERVLLPQLRVFKISSYCTSGADLHECLISHLELPPRAKVSLTSPEDTVFMMDVEDFALLASIIRGVLRHGDAIMTIKLDELLFEPLTPTGAIHFGRRNIGFSDLFVFAEALNTLKEDLNVELGNIRELVVVPGSLYQEGMGTEHVWTQIYSALPGVRTIYVEHCDITYLRAIGGALDYVCPELQCLRLGCNPYKVVSGLEGRRERPFPSVRELYELLWPRLQAGLGPSTLQLDFPKEHEIDEESESNLRSVLSEIRWGACEINFADGLVESG